MSRAAPVRHNERQMGTRRTARRQLLLKPSAVVNQVVLYVIGCLAKEMGISLHALMVMANHIHDALTDHDARIADFYRDVHSNITKALNRYFGESENLWSTSKPNRVACVTDDALIDKIAYAMANPVQGFLVRYGHQWPGIRMAWPAKPVTVKRPPFYFRGPKSGGKWPDEITITLERPPGHDDLSDEELAAKIKEEIRAKEEAARAYADENGIRFVGRKKVLATSRYSYALSTEAKYQPIPVVAAKDKLARENRIAEDRLWLDRYIEARDRFVDGERDVVFPYGTYHLPRHYGARVEDKPF